MPWHLLGVVAIQAGQHEAAAELIAGRSRSCDAAISHRLMPSRSSSLADLDEAITALRQALQLKSG